MDITVSLQIKIQFDGDKKLSVGNVATAVKGLGLIQLGKKYNEKIL
jgi:hypothetical protein